MTTKEQLKTIINDYMNRIKSIYNYLDIENKRNEIDILSNKMTSSDFWNNKDEAQNIINQLNSLKKKIIEPYDNLNNQLNDLNELIEISDDDMLDELNDLSDNISKELDNLEIFSFLSGKLDRNNAYFSLHAGEGGTEACDWTSMMTRMYRRYFESLGWKCEVLDLQEGEEAGFKSITMHVIGEYAYGYLKSEKGIHRLVRISPFDSNARRHTSFCSVDVMPEINKDIEIEIKDEDIRTDVYRSSGHGGQGVNTTDSAVRLTHKPTGIVVTCQNERSQIKNKATAMNMLKAKLYEIELEKKQEEENKIRGIKAENTWGSQIRSYVFCPYQMVKDLRTEYVDYNIDDVMNGKLQEFINSYIKMKK